MNPLKDIIIKLINVVYRYDEFVNDFTNAITTTMNAIIDFINSVHDNFFFDSLNQDGVEWWENLLAIVPTSTQTIEERKSRIQTKYLSKNHNDIQLLQLICDSWKANEVIVDFVGGKIQLSFIGDYGEPTGLDDLIKLLNDVKPAHLPYSFIYKYLLIKDIHEVMTINQLQNCKINNFEFGVI